MAQARTSLALSQDQRQIQMLAPQLRQSLELLQLPILELREQIQLELESNPTLEERTPDAVTVEVEPAAGEVDDAKELNFKEEFEILARIDDEWCRYFMQDREYESDGGEAEKRRSYFFDSQAQQESLQQHLTQQLVLSDLNEQDRHIGELIIGTINDDGYLVQSVEELAETSGGDAAHMRDVLALIQEFDPIGVGARDLKECLLLQLERLGQGESAAARIVREQLDALGAKHYKEIAQALQLSIEETHQAAKLIANLEPKPGRAFGAAAAAFVTPDVVVEKVGDDYLVILNDDQLPDLRISKHYREMLTQPGTAEDARAYIHERMRAGVFLIRSIAQRQQTLRKVAGEIVRVQREFLDAGIAHLKPLTMAFVAERVGLHETTVCRCIANKYMKTPRGTFEMKYFFTPGLKTADGQTVSNKTVQDMIASLVADEDAAHPRTDQELQDLLKTRGITIARRTVAKYRIALKLPPSHLRKAK